MTSHFILLVWVILLGLPSVPVAAPLPTTAADFRQPGTQPDTSLGNFQQPASCATFNSCHGSYLDGDKPIGAEEPYDGWVTSLMAQSARDPVWQAAVAIANADAPGAGETCVRCHAPVGWLAGRSSGGAIGALTASDLEGVTCHFCHRMVAPVVGAGSALGDEVILGALAMPPSACGADPGVTCVAADDCGAGGQCVPTAGQGRFVVDPVDSRRGPVEVGNGPTQVPADHHAPAQTVFSPFHRASAQCAPCHDVSTPTYTRQASGTYALNTFGAPGPFDPHASFPEQRTFSEWLHSDFGEQGPCREGDGTACVAASCQDCHMPDVLAKACASGVARSDMPQHTFAGANTWVLRAIRDLCLEGGAGGAALGCATLPLDKLTSVCPDRVTRCVSDVACGAASSCAGSCVKVPSCSSDTDCGDGGLCVKNAAAAAHCAGDAARACTTDADCAGLGACVGQCGGDARCAADLDCAPDGGACVKSPATFARCAGDALASCSDDADCGATGPCLGQCRGALLPGCATDADCGSGSRCIKDPVRVAETRSEDLLRGGGDLLLRQVDDGLVVRVVNHTGHKLPTGYPEGRRMWLAVRFLDDRGELIREHGGYDFATRELPAPAAGTVLEVFEARHAIDATVASATGLAPGTGFHLALSNTIEKDNRIPPRGFRHATYDAIGAAPKGASYADGQHWDDTSYRIPPGAAKAEVILYFETTSRAYIEFLRDTDPGGAAGAGARAFAQWSKHARPVVVDARRLAVNSVAGSTTTTSTTLPLCLADGGCEDGDPCTVDYCDRGLGCLHDRREGSCDDGDACTAADRCEAQGCVGRVIDVAGVECRLARLAADPCGAEMLPRKLDKRIRKKAQKAVSLLEKAVKAADKGRQERAEKLRDRAAQQLDAISQQAAKAAAATKATKRISAACLSAIDSIVSSGRLEVEGLELEL